MYVLHALWCYKSAWLADLISSYLLDNSNALFERTTIYHGIYGDDRSVFLVVNSQMMIYSGSQTPFKLGSMIYVDLMV